MMVPDPQYDHQSLPPGDARRERIKAMAGTPGFAAALLLLFGWWLWGIEGVTSHPTYNTVAAGLPWVLVGGGMAMAISAVICSLGIAWGLAFDGVATIVVGAAMLLQSGTQLGIELAKPDLSVMINSVLTVIFGFMFIASGRRSLGLHRMLSAPVGVPVARPMRDLEAQLDAPEAEPPDMEGRREAMQRLLRHKKLEPAPRESGQSVAPDVEAAPAPPAAEAATLELAAPDEPISHAEPPRPPDKEVATDPPEKADKSREPEGGFLADLGREN